MKKVVLLFFLAGLLMSGLTVASTEAVGANAINDLTDINRHWAKENITTLVNRKIILGYGDKTFKPENRVTRAEFLAIFAKAAGLELNSNPLDLPFADVKPGDWYYPAVRGAVQQQILRDTDYNGKLAADSGITRKEVARILVRGLESNSQGELPVGSAVFEDLQGLDNELVTFIRKADQAKIMNGYLEGGKRLFKPNSSLTRAEAATVIIKFMTSRDSRLLQKYVEGEIDIDRQMRDIQYLASDELKGRAFGSAEEKTAAQYVENSFRESNLKPFSPLGLDGYTQTFRLRNVYDGRVIEPANVIGMIEGTTQKNEFIVLAAHYDHLGVDAKGQAYNGADDNASSVSALLEIARVFDENKIVPNKSIVFVAFSGEEKGSFGSQYFCRTAVDKDLVKMEVINLEVIGAASGDYLEMFTENLSGQLEVIECLKQSTQLQGIKHKVVDDLDPGSDAYSFLNSGIPAYSVDWAWSAANHPYYHTVNDDYDKVNKDCVAKATRAVAGAVLLLAGVK